MIMTFCVKERRNYTLQIDTQAALNFTRKSVIVGHIHVVGLCYGLL